MNDALKDLAVEAGAPEDMLNALWFNVFCQKFAYLVAEELVKKKVSNTTCPTTRFPRINYERSI